MAGTAGKRQGCGCWRGPHSMASSVHGPGYSQAYVWVWLEGATQAVVAGLLSKQGQQLVFNYGRSYLARPDAIALYEPELPLRAEAIALNPGLSMPSCIRDASPDAWGRRVLTNRKLSAPAAAGDGAELDELTYLLESGSDRIGALDFQLSPTQYLPRQAQQATLDQLSSAADEKLAEIIRHRLKGAKATLRELFGRLVFNVLCGNTDDHARNHAAFWNGRQLELTPAYDICPQAGLGQQVSQAVLIRAGERSSQLAICVAAAPAFLLGQEQAVAIVNHQVSVIECQWQAVCDEANLSAVDRALLWRRQFLNPFAFLDAPRGLRVPGVA